MKTLNRRLRSLARDLGFNMPNQRRHDFHIRSAAIFLLIGYLSNYPG